ncbi:MAG TPA: pitrilysin family protein [bacterium]|nr:pitrilysin family protein [bacterium]
MKRMASVAVLALALGIMSPGCSVFQKAKESLTKAAEAGRPGRLNLSQQRSSKTVIKQLPNGLTVVSQESFSAPVVAVQLWVKVGSADETDKEAGISHVIEHMMFKGTRNRGMGQTAKDVESLGGDLNAFTSDDHTVYHITIASRYFGQALDILSDLVTNPVFDEAEFNKEKEVILEELRRGNDNPRSRIYKYLFAKAYTEHPYRRPVIGFDQTVRGLTRQDIVDYYKKWYVPGRMTLVVSGSVDSGDVLKAAKTYLGQVPAAAGPSDEDSPRAVFEPPQKSARVDVHREDVAESYMYLCFHVPPFAAEDMAALDVLSVILGGGETSRLAYRVRTERRLVNKIWAYSFTPRDPGLFLVGFDLSENKTQDALGMVLKEIYLLKHEPVEQWEVEKAKQTILTSEIYSRETVDGQAREIGYNYTLTGSPDYTPIYLQKVQALNPEEIKRVARKYLVSRNLTAVGIFPEKSSVKGKQKPVDDSTIYWVIKDAEGWDLDYKPGSLAEAEPITPPEVPAPQPPPSRAPNAPVASDPVKYDLANGIRLIIRESHTVPLVALRAAFEGGVRRETSDDNGINNFIAQTMTEGTARFSSSQIHSMIEARGASIEGFAGRSSIGITLESPSAYFTSCLPVLNEVLRYPTFPDDDVERVRGIILSNIRSQLDQPRSLAFRLFQSELFQDHPYGLDPLGTEKSVPALTRDDLMDYYQGFAVPGNLVIAVVGDVNAADLKRRMEDLFSDWVAEPYSPEPVPLEPPPPTVRESVECKDVNQANIVIGFQGTRVTSPDRYSLEVLSSVLSGMSGRLFTTLRGEQSLAYSVYAFSQPGVDPGTFGVYIGTAPDKETASKDGIMVQLGKVRDEPISKDELDRARRVLIGDYEIRLQHYATQAGHYALDELQGIGYQASQEYASKIEAVTADDVRAAADKYIKPSAYVMAVIKPCGAQAAAGGQTPGTAVPAAGLDN